MKVHELKTEMDHKFDELRGAMDRKFADVDRRFDELREGIDQKIVAEGERTRRHFDVVAEQLKADTRSMVGTNADRYQQTDKRHADLDGKGITLDAAVDDHEPLASARSKEKDWIALATRRQRGLPSVLPPQDQERGVDMAQRRCHFGWCVYPIARQVAMRSGQPRERRRRAHGGDWNVAK